MQEYSLRVLKEERYVPIQFHKKERIGLNIHNWNELVGSLKSHIRNRMIEVSVHRFSRVLSWMLKCPEKSYCPSNPNQTHIPLIQICSLHSFFLHLFHDDNDEFPTSDWNDNHLMQDHQSARMRVVVKRKREDRWRRYFIGIKPTLEPSLLQDWVGSEWGL